MAAPTKPGKKAAPKAPAKPVKAATATEAPARKRKLSKYKSFRLQKKIPHPAGPLPSAWILLRKTRQLVWKNKKPVAILLLIYLFLNIAFVRGFTPPLNIPAVKDQLSQFVGDTASKPETTIAVFTQLVTTDAQESASAGIYQVIMVIILALSLTWLYRQSATGSRPTARDALYKGMYPLIPLLLVLFVMFLEIVPAVIGTGLYSATVSSGVAVSGYEIAIWTLLSAMLIILTLYMLFSSLFAVFIVTLPDMTPLKALRSARNIVFSRRLNILLKLLVLPLAFLLLLVLIVVPAIYFAAPFAPWIYLLLTAIAGFSIHAYLFTLYKEML